MRICLLAVALLCSSQANAAEPAIHVVLEGKWIGNAPDETKITYEFTKDGAITWFVEEPNFMRAFPNGLKGKYKIRVADPAWQIDITDFDSPQFKEFQFLGIVTIINAKSFRMEGRPGQRPKKYGDDAVVFRAEEKAKQ